MRKPRETIGKPWANYLRSKRLQTCTRKSHYRGAWPMTQANFAAWLSGKAGMPISGPTYISWENGTRTPKPETMDVVRKALDTNELPFEKEPDDDPKRRRKKRVA